MAEIRHKPTLTTLTSLPREIQHEILLHLLIEPDPIQIIDRKGVSWTSDQHEQQQVINLIDVTPNSHEIFYRRNTFYVGHDNLLSFLNHRPCTTITTKGLNGKLPTPRDFVRHIIISIQPHLYFRSDAPDYHPGRALRSLLTCPNLQKVEVKVMGFLEAVSEFDRTFQSIAGVCSELGDRLGADGLKAECQYLYGSFTWSLAQFKSGFPPR